MSMTKDSPTALERLAAAKSRLPDYEQDAMDEDFAAEAEQRAEAWDSEATYRDAETMKGVEELRDGKGISLDEWTRRINARLIADGLAPIDDAN